jgi:hypothetical protein
MPDFHRRRCGFRYKHLPDGTVVEGNAALIRAARALAV